MSHWPSAKIGCVITRTYRNASYPLIGGASILVILGVTAWYALSPTSIVSRVAVALGGCVLSWVAYRFYIRTRVVSDSRGVTVVNPISTIVLTWSEIDRFSAGNQLVVLPAVGDPVAAWAVQAANGARMLGRRSFADDVAADLNRLKLAAGNDPGMSGDR